MASWALFAIFPSPNLKYTAPRESFDDGGIPGVFEWLTFGKEKQDSQRHPRRVNEQHLAEVPPAEFCHLVKSWPVLEFLTIQLKTFFRA